MGFEVCVALVLAATAVAAAVIGARHDDLAGGASGQWARSVRVEIKRSVATTSADQLVYGTTVPNVAQLQQATVQAKAYLAELGSDPGLTDAERDALGTRAQVEYQRSMALAGAGTEARYFGADHYSRFDLKRALADNRRDSVQGLEDPVAIRRDADRLSRFSVADGVAQVLAALAVLLVSVAIVLNRARLAVLLAGVAALGASVAVLVAVEIMAAQ